MTEREVEDYFKRQQQDMKWKPFGEGGCTRSYYTSSIVDLLKYQGLSNKEIAEILTEEYGIIG